MNNTPSPKHNSSCYTRGPLELQAYESCYSTELKWLILFEHVYMDKKGGLARTNSKSQEIVNDLAAQLDLIDAWRIINPDSRKYTWRRRRPEISCRLDFFLVSQSLMCSVASANISAGYKTDHSLIDIRIALHSNPRGPGFWKLNTCFLTEIDC